MDLITLFAIIALLILVLISIETFNFVFADIHAMIFGKRNLRRL